MMTPKSRPNRHGWGFTLVEMLVAIAVLVLLMAIILQATSSIQRATALSTGTLTAFQEARFAYEELTGKLGQATLNTYWNYDSQTQPTRYQRTSELQFLCGNTNNSIFSDANLFTSGGPYPTNCIFFESPLGAEQSASYGGLENLLNACGYYVEFGNDTGDRPTFLASLVSARWRFRLKEWQPASENFALYSKTSGNPNYFQADWITLSGPLTGPNTRTLAENIVALVILPKLSTAEDPTGALLSPDYFYNSRSLSATDNSKRNQLPPLVQVIMVAIDEPSAIKLAAKNGSAMPKLLPTSPQLFTNSANLQSDLDTLEAILSAKPGNATGNTVPLNYIVMNSDVSIHAAKWSAF